MQRLVDDFDASRHRSSLTYLSVGYFHTFSCVEENVCKVHLQHRNIGERCTKTGPPFFLLSFSEELKQNDMY